MLIEQNTSHSQNWPLQCVRSKVGWCSVGGPPVPLILHLEWKCGFVQTSLLDHHSSSYQLHEEVSV